MISATTLKDAAVVIEHLQKQGIDPILYGSLGASLYLGDFKQFNDVDLLVPDEWMQIRWPELQQIMHDIGFRLVDEHEHEFKDNANRTVAFAGESVLVRDNIVNSLDNLITTEITGLTVRTLTPRQFKKAYSFSVNDGYRTEARGKKDQIAIDLFTTYIDSH